MNNHFKEFKSKCILIFAILKSNFGIGYKGKLPWNLKQDIKFFKDVTSTTLDKNKINVVLMGRKTWDSLPETSKPLKNRINCVLSKTFKSCENKDIIFCNSIQNFFHKIEIFSKENEIQIERIYVIGGSMIYNEFLKNDLASFLVITIIENKDIENDLKMDTFINLPENLKNQINNINNKDQKIQWIKQSKIELDFFFGNFFFFPDVVKEGNFILNFSLWKKSD